MCVRCLLCGEEFRAIASSHLKFVHNITMDDYRRMFPDAELTSVETRQLLREASLGNQYGLGRRSRRTRPR